METVRAEVKRRTLIHWDKSPVKTLEVEHRSKGLTARTWVRPDGLVLRQEVALPDAPARPGTPARPPADDPRGRRAEMTGR